MTRQGLRRRRRILGLTVVGVVGWAAHAWLAPLPVRTGAEEYFVEFAEQGEMRRIAVDLVNDAFFPVTVIGGEEGCGPSGCNFVRGLPERIEARSTCTVMVDFRAGMRGEHITQFPLYLDHPAVPVLYVRVRSIVRGLAENARGRDPTGNVAGAITAEVVSEPITLKAYDPPTAPLRIELGCAPRGVTINRRVEIVNATASAWQVDRVASSCDCAELLLDQKHVGAGKSLKGELRVDLSRDPEFAGRLGIEMAGQDREGRTYFELTVHLAVEP